jgi:hypothetical protein
MMDWLSFWNAGTLRRSEEELDGEVVDSIYIPFGKNEIELGDTIYCVGIEGGELRLLTRLVAASLSDDLEHAESVRVTANSDVPVIDYDRGVPPDVLAVIRFAQTDGSEHSVVTDGDRGPHVDGHRFQGRSSLRRLVAGAAELDALLVSSAPPTAAALKAVGVLADDYEEALDFLEDFCERFYWIKDHPDYQAAVREFLTLRGREPRGIG